MRQVLLGAQRQYANNMKNREPSLFKRGKTCEAARTGVLFYYLKTDAQWDIREQKKTMKKLIALLCVVMLNVALFAEDGYGTCRVPGSSDYIEVSVSISNGEMRISNSSSRPVVSVFVSVTATEYCSKDEKGQEWTSPKTYKATLFNDRVWSLAPYETKTVSINVPSTHSYHQGWRDVNVTVNNPNCQ